jgi:hypothetical protein
MGCTEDAPVCVDGAWQCGAITCPNGCFYNGEVHPAFEVFPAGDGCNDCVCLEDGSVACTDQACATCMTDPPTCDPPDPACSATPACEDGTNWTCETKCDPAFCGGVPPCPAPPPGCTGNPVCTYDGWVCESFCSPMCTDPEPICDAPPNCMAYASCGVNGWECVIAC